MAFRTLEISNPAELHVHRGQLEVENEKGTFVIPLDDLSTVVCSGANIRISTMAEAKLAEADISLMIIDEKYQPVCVVTPIKTNVRQTAVMRRQISMSDDLRYWIWHSLIKQKINNQARVLTLLGLEGTESVLKHIGDITRESIDICEAKAAKKYFFHLHPGLNRRLEDPVKLK